MYPLRVAVRNLMRYPKNTVWMALILILFASALTAAVLIHDAANRNLRACEERYGTVVSIIPDVAQWIGGEGVRERFPRIGLEEYLLYASTPHVRELKITGLQNCEGVNLLPAEGYQELFMTADGNIGFYPFRLVGGISDLAERMTIMGSTALRDGECILSMEVAMLNGLSLGDEIKLHGDIFFDGEGLEVSRKLTRTLMIAGLYAEKTEPLALNEGSALPQQNHMMGWRGNEIFTTFQTLTEGILPGEYGLQITAAYHLNEPGLVAAFDEDLREMGLDPAYRAAYDESGYQRAIQPAQTALSITATALWILPVMGAAALTPLSLSAIRARKKETALLKAMGMRTRTLITSILTETVLITAVCTALGFIVGMAAAPGIVDLFTKLQTDSVWGMTAQAALPVRGNALTGAYRIFMQAPSPPELSAAPSPAIFFKVSLSLMLAFLVPRVLSLLRLRQADPIRTLGEGRETPGGGEI